MTAELQQRILTDVEGYLKAAIADAGFDKVQFIVELAAPPVMDDRDVWQRLAYRVWSGVFVLNGHMYLPLGASLEVAEPYIKAHLEGTITEALRGWTRNHEHFDKVKT